MIYDNVLKLMDKSLNPYNDRDFRMILVVSMALLQIDEEECSKYFDIARSTVENWIWGASTPCDSMRVPIWDILKEKIIKAGNEFDKTKESEV